MPPYYPYIQKKIVLSPNQRQPVAAARGDKGGGVVAQGRNQRALLAWVLVRRFGWLVALGLEGEEYACGKRDEVGR